jgi:hypothetical protein
MHTSSVGSTSSYIPCTTGYLLSLETLTQPLPPPPPTTTAAAATGKYVPAHVMKANDGMEVQLH